ncbi:hypothetical protein HJC23_005846 [Cyclotella cryptica]|uniref:Uncharacterized protein n=1 Tax=Cyclotella cryptica TaxID=29204 RepID=A0ABD3QZ09_9STRA|eukprot:CCRYP_000355-RA/>CCRYP_000355-RA protein AED:0.39 eAED:0.39 QI:0/-1/0/1/-1/1/1/0/339
MPPAATGHRLSKRFAFLFVLFVIHHRSCFYATCFTLDTRRGTSGSGWTLPESAPTRRLKKQERSNFGPLTMSESTTHNNESTNGKTSLLISNIHKISLNSSAPTPSSLHLILASASPRRREILDMMGLSNRYAVQPSPLDEKAFQTELMNGDDVIEPREYARILAERKAGALCEQLVTKRQQQAGESERGTTLVIGSDTIVDFESHILEKPDDMEDAYNMLNRLSGHWHMVHTGVAMYAILGNEAQRTSNNTQEEGDNHMRLMFSFTDTARVKFASLSEEDIRSYIATNEPMDKAGSYGIQGIGGQLVENMEGDFFTVMGLPMHRLSRSLNGAIADLGF